MSLVEYTEDSSIGLIRLNRPPVNALSFELIDAIEGAVDAAATPDVRAVVITGEPHFAAGADIKGFLASLEAGESEPQALALGAVVRKLELLAKPTIAAVHGYALGGGLELAMGADFRYLAAGATVGQPEVGLGLLPGAGGTQRLPRLVGYQAAKELILSGRHVGAEEALALGIADRVLPDEDVLDAAMTDAARWAAGPTKAYAAAKRAMGGADGLTFDAALALEQKEFAAAFGTDDARSGIEAFINKEKPEFEGR